MQQTDLNFDFGDVIEQAEAQLQEQQNASSRNNLNSRQGARQLDSEISPWGNEKQPTPEDVNNSQNSQPQRRNSGPKKFLIEQQSPKSNRTNNSRPNSQRSKHLKFSKTSIDAALKNITKSKSPNSTRAEPKDVIIIKRPHTNIQKVRTDPDDRDHSAEVNRQTPVQSTRKAKESSRKELSQTTPAFWKHNEEPNESMAKATQYNSKDHTVDFFQEQASQLAIYSQQFMQKQSNTASGKKLYYYKNKVSNRVMTSEKQDANRSLWNKDKTLKLTPKKTKPVSFQEQQQFVKINRMSVRPKTQQDANRFQKEGNIAITFALPKPQIYADENRGSSLYAEAEVSPEITKSNIPNQDSVNVNESQNQNGCIEDLELIGGESYKIGEELALDKSEVDLRQLYASYPEEIKYSPYAQRALDKMRKKSEEKKKFLKEYEVIEKKLGSPSKKSKAVKKFQSQINNSSMKKSASTNTIFDGQFENLKQYAEVMKLKFDYDSSLNTTKNSFFQTRQGHFLGAKSSMVGSPNSTMMKSHYNNSHLEISASLKKFIKQRLATLDQSTANSTFNASNSQNANNSNNHKTFETVNTLITSINHQMKRTQLYQNKSSALYQSLPQSGSLIKEFFPKTSLLKGSPLAQKLPMPGDQDAKWFQVQRPQSKSDFRANSYQPQSPIAGVNNQKNSVNFKNRKVRPPSVQLKAAEIQKQQIRNQKVTL